MMRLLQKASRTAICLVDRNLHLSLLGRTFNTAPDCDRQIVFKRSAFSIAIRPDLVTPMVCNDVTVQDTGNKRVLGG